MSWILQSYRNFELGAYLEMCALNPDYCFYVLVDVCRKNKKCIITAAWFAAYVQYDLFIS